MDTINIHHAFNGFLYSPLFVASKLGLFPECARLVYQKGDVESLEALCSHSEKDGHNWFAICDPFSLDFTSMVPAHTDDDICVVGCMIARLPVWVYNIDRQVIPVDSEAALSRYNENIKTLVCYKPGTTGHLIGERLKQQYLKKSALREVDFGSEFDGTLATDTAIVTSDVLQIVHNGLDDKKVIFNYPWRSPKNLSPFLFTGILTLQNRVVDENLWAVLSVLSGIHNAIEMLRQPNPDPRCISILCEHFQPQLSQMGVEPEGHEPLIKAAVKYAFRDESLYPESLTPHPAAWNNAKEAWEGATGRKFVDIEERDQPLPSLLIRRDWRTHHDFRQHVNRGPTNAGSIVREAEWTELLIFVAVFILWLLSTTSFIQAYLRSEKPTEYNAIGFTWCALCLVTLTPFALRVVWKLFKSQPITFRGDAIAVVALAATMLFGALTMIH